jgi:CHAD domain-containing protein
MNDHIGELNGDSPNSNEFSVGSNGASAHNESNSGRSLTLGEFAHSILDEQYHRFAKQEKKVLADNDPEHLHHMRVAIRRMRTGLRIFGMALDLPKAAGDKHLRNMARLLGQLRDLDVQVASLKTDYQPRLNKTEQRLLSDGIDALQKQRRKAFSNVADSFNRSAYQDLKAAYERWLKHPRYKPQAQFPLQTILPDLLTPILSNLLLHPGWLIPLSEISSDNAPTLHDLRKVFKQARYQAEFFSSFYDEKFANWIEEMKALQDSLGKVQDGQVLLDLMADELSDNAKLPKLQIIIHEERDMALSNWEPVRQKYLSSEYRYHLHSLISNPTVSRSVTLV